MIITIKEFLGEGTPAADSLSNAQKSKPGRDAEAHALEVFMKLDADQKVRHIDYLTKALADSAVWTKGSGVPADTAKKSLESLKAAQKKKKQNASPTVKEIMSANELEDALREAFPDLTEDLREKFGEIFHEAVEDQAAKIAMRDALREIYNSCPALQLYMSEHAMKRYESAVERHDELSSMVEAAEAELELLRAEEELRLSAMNEEAIFAHAAQPRSRRRSLTAESLWEVDPESTLLGEESHQRRGDKVTAYADYIRNTTGRN
jgi:hypothetical protein